MRDAETTLAIIQDQSPSSYDRSGKRYLNGH